MAVSFFCGYQLATGPWQHFATIFSRLPAFPLNEAEKENWTLHRPATACQFLLLDRGKWCQISGLAINWPPVYWLFLVEKSSMHLQLNPFQQSPQSCKSSIPSSYNFIFILSIEGLCWEDSPPFTDNTLRCFLAWLKDSQVLKSRLNIITILPLNLKKELD